MTRPSGPTAPVLVVVVQHVDWEGPHRIAAICAARGLPLITCRPLDGDPLPDHDQVSAAVVMGGPMNVDDLAHHPALAEERRWLAGALERDMPLLGVCLGSQLLARALGAQVWPGPRPEIGWAPVEILDPTDRLLGHLAPTTTVLHWHGDIFELPPGATMLARSGATACQAFRIGSAWGLLFHPEADRSLVEAWLAEPTMRAEARRALGPDAVDLLLSDARQHEAHLIATSTAALGAFADLVAARRVGQRS